MCSASCSEYQRYQLLRAIHNYTWLTTWIGRVVPNIKDINFWEQFTTHHITRSELPELFRISKISTFESNSQLVDTSDDDSRSCSEYQRYQLLRAIHNERRWTVQVRWVVPNIKDINFWEQFTTGADVESFRKALFRISKISTFESNSQRKVAKGCLQFCCSEYQRYQLLRAIHNTKWLSPRISRLFRISKISTFESNSQLRLNML